MNQECSGLEATSKPCARTDSATIGPTAADLTREDDLGSVVRAHIRLENKLYTIIEALAPNPGMLKKLDLDYDQTVSLALVLGLDEGWAAALRAFGKLRNRFAHVVDTALDNSIVHNLYEALPAMGKANVQAVFEGLKLAGHVKPEIKRHQDLDPKARLQLVAVAIHGRLLAWQRKTPAPA